LKLFYKNEYLNFSFAPKLKTKKIKKSKNE